MLELLLMLLIFLLSKSLHMLPNHEYTYSIMSPQLNSNILLLKTVNKTAGQS